MHKKISDESGLTLVETLIAILILLAGLLSLAQVMAFTVVASKTHGRDAAQTTAAAEDKMEELLNLRFDDVATDITVDAPYPSSGGTGLAEGGSIPPADPVTGYVDYLDVSGNRIAASSAANAGYTRQWQVIDDPSGAVLKKIIVTVTSNRSFAMGTAPSTTLVTEKVPTIELETP